MENYEKYLDGKNLKELLDISRSIDREKYPDRYASLKKAIAKEENKLKSQTEFEEKSTPINKDTLRSRVTVELENIENPQKDFIKNFGILALTLFLFVSFGFFDNSVANIVVILFVLFVHEMGHFIGMKIFGYKDVKMFFIPMLGAAVSGVEKNPNSVKKAVISLLGPVPGILLGIILAVVYFKTGNELVAVLSSSFLFINGFNLLPFHPLDGGRFFDYLLFSRNPKIEIIFKVITTLALVGFAFLFEMPLLGIFALFIIASLKTTYLVSNIAHNFKSDPEIIYESGKSIPEEQMEIVLEKLKDKINLKNDNAKALANYVHNIWQRVCNKPASIFATIVMILIVYLPMMTVGISAPFLFEAGKAIRNTKTEIIERWESDGSFQTVEIKSLNGKVLSEIPLDGNGYYHGLQKTWHYSSGSERAVGYWKTGFWDGEWKFYDKGGNLQSVREYKMGVPKKYSKMKNGQLEIIPEKDWPFIVKHPDSPKALKSSRS